MRKDRETRLLPQFTLLRGPAQCEARRFVLSSTWVACCVLLMILLLGEFHYFPAVQTKRLKLVMPSDFKQYTRYLRQNTVTSTKVMVTSEVTVQYNSSGGNSAEPAEVSLDDLWKTIPFTTVVKAANTRHEYEASDQEVWQKMGAHSDHATGDAVQPLSTVVLQPQQQRILAPLQLPDLSFSHDHNIALLMRYAQEAVKHTVTAEEARSGYTTAFERVVPLHPDSPWHVTPTAVWQQPQESATVYESSTATATQTPTSSSSGQTPAQQDSQASQQQLIRSHDATAAAQQLMTLALVMLKSTRKLVQCGTEDSSMPQLQPEQAGGPPGGRVLLAAVLSDQGIAAADGGAAGFSAAGDAMPNFVLQVVMFAMQSRPGAIFVSIVHDSSSSSTSNRGPNSSSSSSSKGVLYWMDVMKLLLLPLRVPLLVTDAAEVLADTTTGDQASNARHEAALRNSAIDRFFSEQAKGCSSSSTGSDGAAASSNAQGASNSIADEEAEKADTQINQDRSFGSSSGSSSSNAMSEIISHSSDTSSVELSAHDLAACFQPDWVLFIDGGVLFCKADLHRLLMHRHADVACGWDLRMAEPAAAVAPPTVAAAAAASVTVSSSVPAATAAAVRASSSDDGGRAVVAEGIRPTLDNGSASTAGVTAAAETAATAGLNSDGSAMSHLVMVPQIQLGASRQQVDLLLAATVSSSGDSSSTGANVLVPEVTSNIPDAVTVTAATVDVRQRRLQQQVVEYGVLNLEQLQMQQQQLQMQQQHGHELPHTLSTVSSISSSSAGQADPTVEQSPQQQQSDTVSIAAVSTAQLTPGQELSSNNSLLPPTQQLPLLLEQRQHLVQLHNQQHQQQQQLLLLQQQQQHVYTGRPHSSILYEFPFYYGDAAVGRLVTGQQFDVVPPYAAAHMPTQSRLAAGLPMQVYCCWSGLAKLRAEPFRQGLRFRSHQLGECKTTPQNLICDDLHRLGFSKVLADPGVLVTRQLELSARISNSVKQAERMAYIRRSRWLEVQGSGSPWLLSQQQLRERTYRSVTCCDKSSDELAQAFVSALDDTAFLDSRFGTGTGDSADLLSGVQRGDGSSVGSHGTAAIKSSSTAPQSGSAMEFINNLYHDSEAVGSKGITFTHTGNNVPAAGISYQIGRLGVEDFVAAAEGLPVGRATVGQVNAATRLRAAGTWGMAAAADMQQCTVGDIIARNFTEGFLWQVKQQWQQLQPSGRE